MFPIDSNLLIAVLVFAMIPIYILILRKLKPEPTIDKNIPQKDQNKRNSNNRKKRRNAVKEILEITQPKQSESTCPHHFGYLRKLPKDASLPDECLGCPQIVKCLTQTSNKNDH